MRLEKLLRGKRYLLVLDDYWSENWQDWDKLKRSFVSGARGSKIIVTTRSRKVAHFLGTRRGLLVIVLAMCPRH
jgi:hypothetical protein